MCPVCLASVALTVASTTAAGGAAAALAVRVKRALTKHGPSKSKSRKDEHDRIATHRHA
jgi:hypothetical protein